MKEWEGGGIIKGESEGANKGTRDRERRIKGGMMKGRD